MKIICSQNPKQEATNALANIFKEYKNIPVLFLSSGGSALSLLGPEILAENPQMTVSVLDEHYVADPNERNYEKLKKTEFFEEFSKSKTPHPTSPLKRGGGATFDLYGGEVEEAGKRFDTFLKDWMVKYPNGKIVVTVGMGADGHTAGIVPFESELEFRNLFNTSDLLAVGYKTDYGLHPERLTATYPLLCLASDVILYAVGFEKSEALRIFEHEVRPFHRFPALFLKSLSSTRFFTGSKIV